MKIDCCARARNRLDTSRRRAGHQGDSGPVDFKLLSIADLHDGMQSQQELAELLLIEQGGETLEEIRKTIGDGRQELTGGRPLEGSRIRVLTIRIAPAQAPFDVVDDTESLGIGQIGRGSPVLERANGLSDTFRAASTSASSCNDPEDTKDWVAADSAFSAFMVS
jgi:hypothetical protein